MHRIVVEIERLDESKEFQNLKEAIEWATEEALQRRLITKIMLRYSHRGKLIKQYQVAIIRPNKFRPDGVPLEMEELTEKHNGATIVNA